MNKTFPASREALPEILAWAQNYSHKIQLIIEETIINIITHSNATTIEISLTETLTIKDDGPPFDPFTQPSTLDPNAPLDKRMPGGLGLEIIRKHIIEYRRENEQNVLLFSIS